MKRRNEKWKSKIFLKRSKKNLKKSENLRDKNNGMSLMNEENFDGDVDLEEIPDDFEIDSL